MVICCPQCAAVQHLLFPSFTPILVFLATFSSACLETFFFLTDSGFDGGLVTAVDSCILQFHFSLQLPCGRFAHFRRFIYNYKGHRTIFLHLLSETQVRLLPLPTFCYLVQVPVKELSSRRKAVALKMNFLKSLKVRMTRTSMEVSVSIPLGNPSLSVNKDVLSNSLDMSICFLFRHLL